MLAQGQSSSAKRGGLVEDISSGLIFLTKKKKFIWEALMLLAKYFTPVRGRPAVQANVDGNLETGVEVFPTSQFHFSLPLS